MMKPFMARRFVLPALTAVALFLLPVAALSQGPTGPAWQQEMQKQQQRLMQHQF